MKKFVTLREAEKFCQKKSNKKIFNWVQSGAEDNYTYEKNFSDLLKIQIKPSHLSSVKNVDLSTNFFNNRISSPIFLSPMGHQTQFHKNGEIEMGKGIENINSIAFFSTQGRISLDDIRKKNKKLKIGWTIFPFGDKKWIKDEVLSAVKNKCVAIAICVDANVRSHRYNDRESRYDARTKGRRTNPLPPNPKLALKYNWKLISYIKKLTKIPIIVKGILTAEDANNAIRHGCDGIWISNHGGRMFNSGISTVDAIIEINKKIKNKKIKIIVDGGIRKGSDIIKFLCLGADFVGIGRPAVHGLMYKGSTGVSDIFKILNSELKTCLINGGFKNKISFNKKRLNLS
jgi:(S)-2-hydroxy-acid oxidase